MSIYKVNLFGGYIGLISANSLTEAKKKAMSEQGSANVQSVYPADPEDIDWVRRMGGVVPSEVSKLPSEWAKDGYFVVEKNRTNGTIPKPGQLCDYYDREGIKRSGTITHFDGQTIRIDSERKTIVKEEFTVRYGR
jgi:hypothetical protein